MCAGHVHLTGGIRSQVEDLANAHAQPIQTMIRNKYAEVVKSYGTVITWRYKLDMVNCHL